MNRHNSHQQPETTADDANADQWQIDVSEQGAGKAGGYGNASGVNGGKNANDTNHISDQGETVEVRIVRPSGLVLRIRNMALTLNWKSGAVGLFRPVLRHSLRKGE